MSEIPSDRWFAVRSIYHFGAKSDGKNIFEERTVAFSASNDEEAFDKAVRESEEYAETHGVECHPELMAYEQDGAALVDGYELWSELYESPEDLDGFFNSRYEQYRYMPEE